MSNPESTTGVDLNLTSHAPIIRSPKDLARLSLGALGVVYGDIGTSPLYAIKECFALPHGVAISLGNVLGILSLVFWALTLIVVVKYIGFVMRADNHGDGGILALLALVTEQRSHPKRGESGHRRWITLVALALFGAALLWADGMITPVISVLGALEGLDVATPFFRPWIVPIALGILIALFLVQRRGTAGIGAVFGPLMLVWFVSIAALGIPAIVRHPEVLAAVNPMHAIHFFRANGLHGFLILGAVVLCVTGSEALYADMGHFGRRPIRIAWFWLVFPALLANYFGQGALLLARGQEVVGEPVLRPGAGLVPLSAGGDRHRGRGDRFAGAHLRRLLARPAGDPARLLAAHDDRPHLGRGERPDLRSGSEHDPHGLLRRPDPDVPEVRQPGGGLRHRGDGDDGDHHDPALLRRAPDLAVAALAGARAQRGSSWPSTSPSSPPTWSRS